MGRKIGTFGLVNYKEHPTEKNYMVVNFNSDAEAELFSRRLNEKKIWFEQAEEEMSSGKIYLFAVKGGDFDKVQRINFEVTGKFKEPLIRNNTLRYVVIIFFLVILTIAVVGYVKNSGAKAPDQTEKPQN